MIIRPVVILVFFGIFISACATTPTFETASVDRSLTPENVLENEAANQGKTVLWGGIILDVKNLQDKTQLEILAYPLNRSERPLQNDKPLGRVIVLHSGFLEPTVYMQGKIVSAQGVVGQSQTGTIGDTRYVYPVVHAEQLHIWKPRDNSTRSSFHLGIGIGF